jgi:hypothetical protein
MDFVKTTLGAVLVCVFFTVTAAGQASAQSIKAGELNGRLAAAADPGEKGKPGPLPCNSKNNPKCDNVTPTKPGDTKGNNGVGNGVDPQPPGNPPINDGPGTGPGNPGAKNR